PAWTDTAMHIPNRREFLLRSGAGALAGLGTLGWDGLALARGLLTEPLLDEVVGRALDAARRAGCSYADGRIMRRRDEAVMTREDHVTDVQQNESYGVGVRVLHSGAWGFAASSQVEPLEAARVATLAASIAQANAKRRRRPVTLATVAAHVD